MAGLPPAGMLFVNKPKGVHMFKKRTKVIMVALAVLTLAGVAAMPVLAADERDPEAEPGSVFDGNGIRRFFSGALARTFRYQKSMVVFIGDALESASSSAEKAYTRIAELEEEGKDVSMLPEAVSDFETLYAQAETDHEAALALVDAHAGFDLNERIDDLGAARETVKAVEPYLSSAREKMVDAIQTITSALREYKDVNQD